MFVAERRSETEPRRETESCESEARTPRREERSFDILTAKVVGINKPLEIGQRNSTVGRKTRTLFGYLAVVTWWTVEGMGAGAGANGWGRRRVGVEGSGCDRGPRAADHGPRATGTSRLRIYIHGERRERMRIGARSKGVGKMGRLSWLGRIGRGREAGGGGGGGSGDGVGNGNGNRHGYGHGYWVGYGGRSVERAGRV